MKQIVAAGTIKAGHMDMTICFSPEPIGWRPRSSQLVCRCGVDHDELRKRRIEDRLAEDDPI